MARSTIPSRLAPPIALALAGSVAGWPAAGLAQTAEPPAAAAAQPSPAPAAGEFRLSDEEREAILNGATIENAAAARGELPLSGSLDRGIHGEVGVMIGSNGMRSEFGTAAIPLGDNAGAVVSFENSRWRGYPK